MAEEQQAAPEAPVAVESPPPKKSSSKFIFILLFLLAAGGGGYFAYIKYFQPAMLQTESDNTKSEEKESQKEEPANDVMVPLEPFLVNLAGSEGKRFLKVTITLELNAPEVQAEVQANKQKILDSILVLLSSKTFEDVYSVQGKFKVKDEVTTRVNRFLIMGHIKDVYFSEFVIQ